MENWIVTWQRLAQGELPALIAVLCGYAVFTAIESAMPAERGQGWPGRLRNLGYLAIFDALGLAALATWYAFRPSSGSGPAPNAIDPLWLLPANLFAIDFAYYWYHRAQHRWPALWAVHELHHADRELNVTTSYRTHWLEAPFQAVLVAAPVVMLMGHRDPKLGLFLLIASRFFFLFSHSNVRLSLGPLTPLLCGPQWHRIHHSRLPQHRDRNFAQVFPCIDWLFGTYYSPRRDEFPPTGTEHLASDAPVLSAELRPFRLWRDGVRGLLARAT